MKKRHTYRVTSSFWPGSFIALPAFCCYRGFVLPFMDCAAKPGDSLVIAFPEDGVNTAYRAHHRPAETGRRRSTDYSATVRIDTLTNAVSVSDWGK